MKKRVVIYARFSSYGQTEQSIEGQLRECYDFARRNEYAVIGEYIDRAMTGTNDKRPSFLKMIDDSKKKTFDFVLVYQLDRFARNRYDSANYKAKLKKNGVRVLSAKESITDDASGILVEGMLESMAEYYSAELSQKVKRGIKESLIKGNFIGGYGLFGYSIVDKKWTINPYEARIVKEAFTRYSNGEKAKDIAEWMNAQGVKNRAGNDFGVNAFARMIRNERYTGKLREGETLYTNIIPPIIDEKLFWKCNTIMDAHKHKSRQTNDLHSYILSGKLFCGYCNSMMTAETGTSVTGRVYHYYKCFGKKQKNVSCTKKNAKKDALENLVFNATIKYVLRPDIIDKAAKIITKRFNSDLKKSAVLQTLEKDLAMCNKAIDGIMAAIEQGIVTKTTRERLTDLERQQSVFEEKLAVEQAKQVKPITEDNVRAFIKYFANKRYETQEAKNEFFNSFINRVILYDDRAVIIYNIDPDHEKTISAKDNLAIEEALHKEKPIYKATDEIAKYIDGEFINTAANENGEADFEAKNAANKGKSSPELSQFKRACRGAASVQGTIDELPEASNMVYADIKDVMYARSQYEKLSDAAKKQVDITKLLACEEAAANIPYKIYDMSDGNVLSKFKHSEYQTNYVWNGDFSIVDDETNGKVLALHTTGTTGTQPVVYFGYNLEGIDISAYSTVTFKVYNPKNASLQLAFITRGWGSKSFDTYLTPQGWTEVTLTTAQLKNAGYIYIANVNQNEELTFLFTDFIAKK